MLGIWADEEPDYAGAAFDDFADCGVAVGGGEELELGVVYAAEGVVGGGDSEGGGGGGGGEGRVGDEG